MRTWALDMAERAIWTAVQAFLAVWTVTDLSNTRTAAVAALAAAISAVKSGVAMRYPNTISPASMVADNG